MRRQVIAVTVAVLNLYALGVASAQNQSGSIVDRLVGSWTAEPSEVRLSTDLDISVWGPNASSVRVVELTIQPSGEGHIKVTRSVVDGRGRTKRGSVSVEEAQLLVRAPETSEPNRVELIVDVMHPERRYLDDPKDRWPLDGLKVKLVATDLDHNRLNLHFDLPDGRGSFGETLVRRAARPARGRGRSNAG
jgi:hypothetical protein